MVQAQRPYIAREGWRYIAVAITCAVAVHAFAGAAWAVPLWLAGAVLVYLFRDPERAIPPVPLGVVSPVDGRITAVEEGATDPFLQRPAIRVAIRMRRGGTYSTRSPIEGKVMKQWLVADGARDTAPARSAGAQAAGGGPENHGIWIQSDENDDVVLAMRADKWAMRPTCYVRIGERTGQGQRCGLVPFGAPVSVWLPPGTRVEVSVGDRVKAGSDIIATFMHKTP